MENKINFNFGASTYIPKNKRQNNEKDNQKYNNSGMEVVYNYQGENNYDNYNYYQNQSYQNQGYGNKKKSGRGNKNYPQEDERQGGYNKGGNYSRQNYQNYPSDNYYGNQSEKNYQNYPSDNYYGNQSEKNYQNYPSDNYYGNQNEKNSQNYPSDNYYRNQSEQNYQNYSSDNYYGNQNEKNSQNYYQGQNNYDKYNNYYNYDNKKKPNSGNEGTVRKVTTDKRGQKVYLVEKDVTNEKVSKQDLEDDYIDENTYEEFTTPSDLTGEDYYEENDVYEEYADYGEDDLYGDEDYFEDTVQNTSDKFSKMNVIQNLTKETNKNNYSSERNIKDDNSSKKHQLIFSNKDGFTNYVEETLKNEKRNYPEISDNYVNVLMIAEKPSIAKSLSEALGGKINSRRMGKGGVVINFDGYFGSTKAKFTVSSVMGHVYTSDFQRQHNDWNAVDYLELYDIAISKAEANRKTKVPFTLQRLAKGKDILCLWLDCDKEGENICYEVIYNVYPFMNKKGYQQIYRAKFSSLTKQDLKSAFNNIRDPPNKNESLSVDARQVIDLKIGVSFTRFLTSAILPGIKNAETKLLSYGPCQTPTLWFCVNRQLEIDRFKSREYFKVYAELEIQKMKHRVPYRKKFFEKIELNNLLSIINTAKIAKVSNVITNKNYKQPPVGLNTVQMLRTASSYLKMSPHETMVIAEKLYTMGYITYPRTETTKYASSFDFVKSLNDFSNHTVFGKKITSLLKNFRKPALRGVDVGDHPPITPSRVAAETDLRGDQWRLYEFICTNYFASLAEAAEYDEKVFQIDINGEIFEADSMVITKEGFLKFMEWKKSHYTKEFPILKQDSEMTILSIITESNWTDPPENLTESDLIKMMEQNKIGTDASMPVHIENICQRGYVKVDGSRKLIPTKLGKALIESLSAVDPEIVQPTIRSEIENYVDQIAKGNRKYEDVLSYAMELYKKKFLIVRQHYEKMLNLFKKYFEIDLMEMNKVYRSIKSKNEALKIQNMVQKSISEVDTDLNTCDQCKKGKMYVEYDSLDKYLLLCTNCKRRTKIVRDAIKIKVNKSLSCQKCSSYYIEVEVENPFLSGETEYTGCLFCDPNLT